MHSRLSIETSSDLPQNPAARVLSKYSNSLRVPSDPHYQLQDLLASEGASSPR